MDEADDAAVVRLGEDALVLTLDFFTPLVDDAYTWGRIACANALSDVYAMGGRPLFGLNIVGWPTDDLPLELLADVLRGGRDVATQAGMVIVGGHTVDDPEPKYGVCVVGRADPDKLMTMDAARPGDELVLTKAIGTGIVTTALKRDGASEAAVRAAVDSMTSLNDRAADVLLGAAVRACTDVTGFGLLGHLHRMLTLSSASAELDPSAVPLLPDARELTDAGFVPGGSERNLEAVTDHVDWGGADPTTRMLLADAQTSGGLLACVPSDATDDVLSELGTPAARIGRIAEGDPGRIRLA